MRHVEYIYCDVSWDEDDDNQRFLGDVEKWLGITVKRIKSTKYTTTDEVFEDRQFMSSPNGACCTTELKKVPRFAYQWPEDIHIFGYTANETMPLCKDPRKDRIAGFERENPELFTDWILRDAGMVKADCHRMIAEAGIEQARMYRLGFPNANCKGCVKMTSPDGWNRTRKHFPETFKRRAEQSRRIGARLVRLKGERIFLDELPPDETEVVKEDLSCGPQCSIAPMKPRKRIKPISPRQAERNKEYALMKKSWRATVVSFDPRCAYSGCRNPVERTPHHIRGRIGSLLCDTRYWVAVCREHHQWIHAHPNQARELGLLAQPGDWGRQS